MMRLELNSTEAESWRRAMSRVSLEYLANKKKLRSWRHKIQKLSEQITSTSLLPSWKEE